LEMKMKFTTVLLAAVFAASPLHAQSTGKFIVAAFNVENWNEIERGHKPNQPKPQAEKDAVVSVITTIRPDVLGIEEMGTTNDLAELVGMLRAKGLDYPNQEWIQGSDEVRHVSLLSRFPITQRNSRTDYNYLLEGKPTRIQRGILDVLVKVNDDYSFRALVVHLKSKRSSEFGDQVKMRLEEARLLRSHIGKILKDNPQQKLIAMGDFNDTPDSGPIRAIIGVPPFALFDILPLDSKGGDGTHYWRARHQFSRIDYLITSPGMSNDYISGSAHIADIEGWDKASDHRMIYASFRDHQGGKVAAALLSPTQMGRAPLLILAGVAAAGAMGIFLLRGKPSGPTAG
jgi:endonuclease/exonuclease/phosphatase family metal-dependent hydrolase